MKFNYFYLLIIVLFASCGPNLPDHIAKVYDELPEALDYNIHVKPILSDRCFACHGNDKNKLEAGLRLNDREAATSELPESPGKYAINTSSLEKSEMFVRLITEDENLVMPPPESNLILTDYEKATNLGQKMKLTDSYSIN